MQSLAVRSLEMSLGTPMLQRYAHHKSQGANISPPIEITALPQGTESLAFMLVDRDANDFVHWAVVDLPPAGTRLEEGMSGRALPDGARELYTTANTLGYHGPNPPPRTGAHKYELVAYALDTPSLEMSDRPTAREFDDAARPHALAIGSSYWMYENR